MTADSREKQADEAGDLDPLRGQPIEESEKNLSRHSTKDSSPSVEEQWRTSVPEANEQPGDKKD
jgi:hypothetical protein